MILPRNPLHWTWIPRKEDMTETAKKTSVRMKTPNEFLIAAKIDRLLEPLSKREQMWIAAWIETKYGQVIHADPTTRGPDRTSRPAPDIE